MVAARAPWAGSTQELPADAPGRTHRPRTREERADAKLRPRRWRGASRSVSTPWLLASFLMFAGAGQPSIRSLHACGLRHEGDGARRRRLELAKFSRQSIAHAG